jgi:hypothetical protein
MIWSMYNIQNDFEKRVKLIISGVVKFLATHEN